MVQVYGLLFSFFSSSFSSLNASNASKSSIKVDILEITTNQYSNIGLYNYGYNVENTLAAYVIDGLATINAFAKLYTYNGLLHATIVEENSATTYPNTKIKLKILCI